MIQGHMHFTKVSRAGSSGKGGGCDGRPRAALPLPSELLVTVLAPITVRGLRSARIVCNPLGPGSSLHLLKYWVSPVCFTFLMGILQCHPGRCFFTPSALTHSAGQKTLIDTLSEQPLDQTRSCTDFHTAVKLGFLGATLELQQCNRKWNQASEYPLFPWLRRTELSL